MVLFALKRPRECETWLLAAQKVRQTNEAFLSQKVFPKNVPPLKKDLIRQPWWWQGLHTFGAKRQKESCCQARLVVALRVEMSFSWSFLGKRNCAVEVNFPEFFPHFCIRKHYKNVITKFPLKKTPGNKDIVYIITEGLIIIKNFQKHQRLWAKVTVH